MAWLKLVCRYYIGVDLIIFLSVALDFNEDTLAFFLLDYFYVNCYKPLVEVNASSAILTKSRHFMANLRDILKYPKFSSSDIANISIADINSHMFMAIDDLDTVSLQVAVFTRSSLQFVSVSYKSYSPVQAMLDDLTVKLSGCRHELCDLDQYGLFVAFDDHTADISLPFDLQ